MSTDLVPVRKFRHSVPEEHRGSLDTILAWMWEQRFGTIQTIFTHTTDVMERTVATLIIQAIFESDLTSIRQIFDRLEGGPRYDGDTVAEGPLPL